MSRRAVREKPAAQAPALPRRIVDLPLVLTAASLILAVLGGGMIYDRVDPQPGFTSLFDLVGVPVAAILGSVALCLQLWQSRGERGEVRWWPLIWWLFLGWCSLSALLAENRFAATTTLALFAGAVATGAAVRKLATTRLTAMAIGIAIAGVASYVAAVGSREYLIRWREGNALWRVFGGFVNPDFLAGYLLVALPITAALFLLAKAPLQRILGGLALLLQLFCFIRTDSRLGLAALLVEIVVFGVLTIRAGGFSSVSRKTAAGATVLVVALLLVAGGPLLRRVLSSGAESHSGRFRLLTWRGTVRMAAAHPLIGTGIGTFETSYPPYQVVGYTQHAHNGFLQLAGETGVPGVLLLLVGLGGATALGFRHVWKKRDAVEADIPIPLIAGCVSGIAGSMTHNLFDSDFYLPATIFTLAGAVGLVLTAVSGRAGATGGKKEWTPLRTMLVAGTGLLTLWIVMVEGSTAAARVAANGAAGDYNALRSTTGEADRATARGLLDSAINGYALARSVQPDNPDYALKLANLCEASGQAADAELIYRSTAANTRLGKAYYRLGRFLLKDRPAEAYAMLLRAREKEPNNLQSLLRLAEAAIAIGKTAEAEKIYLDMISLYRSDFGAVRPLPELVDWEFGVAYVGLGQLQLARGDKAAAEKSLRDGAGILGEFWRTRHLEIAEIRISSDVRQDTASRYQSALMQLASLYDEMGRKADADEMQERLAEFRREKEEDKTRKGISL